MHVLDSSFLVDYADADRDGHDDAVAFLEANDGRPFFVPTHVLYELYRGAARVGREIEEMAADLDWLEPVGFDESAAREAATIDVELLSAGEPVNAADVLVAGTVRSVDGALVTDDADFERIDGLPVVRYRD